MTAVYVVVGESGEYSAHEQWSVRAFATEIEATEFIARCEAYNKTEPTGPTDIRHRNSNPYTHWPAETPVETYAQWEAAPDGQRWATHQGAVRAFWAAAPDTSGKSDGSVIYRIDTVPFGKEDSQ